MSEYDEYEWQSQSKWVSLGAAIGVNLDRGRNS
jgi:hypothetical protein